MHDQDLLQMTAWGLVRFGIGALIGGAWLWHAVAAALGMRKIADLTSPQWKNGEQSLPRVSVIVPAKDEEAMVASSVASLLKLEYPEYEVIAIDDRSTDRTGPLLDGLSERAGDRLKVVHVRQLPEGWLGKTHAMHLGAQQATGEWLLFTDADVLHSPEAMASAVAYGERERVDHIVLLPTVVAENWGEKAVLALFQSLFIFAHRPWKVSDPKSHDFIGMGAFNLVRRSAYDAIGGYEHLRLAVIDDMQLGHAIKESGYRQRVVAGTGLIQVRWAHGLMGVVRNTEKNFFAEFGFSVWLTIAALLGVVALQFGPWLGLILEHGWGRAGYAVALVCAMWVYWSEGKRTGISAAYIALHWLASLLLVYAILRSMVLTLWRGGVMWRGTKYSLPELREKNRSGLLSRRP